MGEPWVVKSNIVGNDPCFGDHRCPTLNYCYRAVTRCWRGVRKHILKPFITSVKAHKPPYWADANIDSTDSTTRRSCCGVGVRVSAPLRRGAAPYADGSLRSQPPSHLIFLPILSEGERFEGGIL